MGLPCSALPPVFTVPASDAAFCWAVRVRLWAPSGRWGKGFVGLLLWGASRGGFWTSGRGRRGSGGTTRCGRVVVLSGRTKRRRLGGASLRICSTRRRICRGVTTLVFGGPLLLSMTREISMICGGAAFCPKTTLPKARHKRPLTSNDAMMAPPSRLV